MVEDTIIICMLIFILGLGIECRFRLPKKQIDLDWIEERIGFIEESLQITANVLNHLPELMPSFHMPQNPLVELISKFMELRNQEHQEDINEPVLLDTDYATKGKEESNDKKA